MESSYLIMESNGLSTCRARTSLRTSDVFAQEEGDICIPNLKLKINLKDYSAVQICYNSIPKPQYKEVKEYIQNLCDRGCIKKSSSSYSSLVVSVKKKRQ